MAIKVTEFSEKYPHYNRGFFAYNPKTETEELLGKLKASLVYDPKTKREYQEFFFDKEIFSSLISIFKEENIVYHFAAFGTEAPIPFVGVRRGNVIYAVCMKTKERVILAYNEMEDYDHYFIVRSRDLMLSV